MSDNKTNNMNLVELKSVGSMVDLESGIIYPQNEDGSPDLDMDISLYDDEVSAEWLDSLSNEDYTTIEPFLDRAGSQLNG